MDKTLKDRLRTVAEMKLLDMDISEFIEEILSDYGEAKVKMTAAGIGLSGLLMEQEENHTPQRKGEKARAL